MRRTPFLALALAFILAAGAAEAQTLKLGFINSQQILSNAPGAAAADSAFQRDLARFDQEAQQLQAEVTGMQQDLERQQLTLSPEAKRNREQQLQQKMQEAQQRMAELDREAQRRRQELIQPVMDRITAIIEQVREEGNYALILDAASGAIVSADPSLDLTEEVIRRLQASAAATPGGIDR